MKENKKHIEEIMRLADCILEQREIPEPTDPQLLAALRQLLQQPEHAIDPGFRRATDSLIKHTLNQSHAKETLYSHPPVSMKYTLTFLAGTFAAVFLTVIVANNYGWSPWASKPITTQTQDAVFSGTPTDEQVREVDRSDFGDIPSLFDGTAPAMDAAVSSKMGMGGGGGIAMERAMIMPPFPGGDLYPPDVTYGFTGNRNIAIPGSIGIYKVRDSEVPTQAVESLIGNLLGVDIQNFLNSASVMLQNVSFQDIRENISYHIDMVYGQVNFYLYREFTGNEKQPAERDIPSDSALIAIANDFLRSRGFDLSSLEAPEVEKEWYRFFLMEKQRAADARQEFIPYIPREMQVIYPMTIEGVPVVNFGGGKEAKIRLSIDILDKKVVSGNFATLQSFEKTEYPAQTAAQVIETLEKTGGTNAYHFGPRPLDIRLPGEDLKPAKIDVSYSESQLAYVRRDTWRENRSRVYFIPVMMFKGQAKHSEQKEPYDQVTFVPVISASSF